MAMDERSALKGGKAFLWMLVLFGSWLVWSGLGEPGKNPRAHWKNVNGEVTAVSKKRAWSDSSGQRLVGRAGFDISTTYTYTVEGVSYSGVFTYYDGHMIPEPRYSVNERVVVYYDPGSPVSSSLLPGDELVVTKEMKGANVFSGTLIIFFGVFFLILIRLKGAGEKKVAG